MPSLFQISRKRRRIMSFAYGIPYIKVSASQIMTQTCDYKHFRGQSNEQTSISSTEAAVTGESSTQTIARIGVEYVWGRRRTIITRESTSEAISGRERL